MALSANDAFAAGKRRHRRGRRSRGALAEINVTPLVDVMLVLLIIFMISAPLLTSGVQVQLPKAEAGALQNQNEPLTVSIREDGRIFVGEQEVPFAAFTPTIIRIAGGNFDKPIYVRADGRGQVAVLVQVMAALSTSGFSKINMLTEGGGPSSGDALKPDAKAK
jgi:biopolymer transport protein TolR